MKDDGQIAARFWNKAKKAEGCWEWTGGVAGKGYGYFYAGEGGMRRAHRVAYELATGKPVPDGLYVCHSCDNRICVRPDHLFLGTAKDNTADMYKKGRQVCMPAIGEDTGHAKLTADTVRAIREALRQGTTKTAIGRQYHVSRTAIYHIGTGRSWAWL